VPVDVNTEGGYASTDTKSGRSVRPKEFVSIVTSVGLIKHKSIIKAQSFQ